MSARFSRPGTTLGDRIAMWFVAGYGVCVLAGLILAAMLLFGCAPVRPNVYEPPTPSFSGSKRNSGVLSPNHRDAGWHARYNSLISAYGADPFFRPALVKDQGVTEYYNDGSVDVTEQARVNFIVMNSWRHDGTHNPTLAGQAQQAALKAGL